MTIRPFEALSISELRLVARDQADAGEPCVHGFPHGSSQAIAYERAYQERRRELDEVEH